MANSRSNIYPVQLQGAELNLNKYDAEIKQYSGFNKNNSPFVGGCLSNIFTKDEVITGANGENVYIDDNGDVYQVTTEGLFKNEEKVIEYPSTVKFYRRRKVEMPSNVVKALNENVYITREDDITFPDTHHASGYLAHWGDGYTAIISEEYSILPPFLDISYKGNSVVFSYKRYITTPSVEARFIIVRDVNESDYRDISNDTIGFGLAPFSLVEDKKQSSQTAWIIDEDHYVLALNEEFPQGNQFKDVKMIAAVTFNGTTWTHTIYKNTDSDLYTNGNVTPFVEGAIYYLFPSVYLSEWYMTNEGLFYYRKTRNVDPSVSGEALDLSSYNNKMFTVVLVIKLSFSTSTAHLEEVIIKQMNVGTANDYSAVLFQGMKGVYAPNYVFFSGMLYLSRTTGQGAYNLEYSLSLSGLFQNKCVSGYISDGKTKVNEITSGGVVFKDDFKILINNNNVSGISVADFYFDNYIPYHYTNESFNGVLIEEWNTIQDFLIYEHKLFYKKNSEYYCVERGTPYLFKVLDQIVCNCNYQQNSYDVKRNIVLHFAPDWNNSWLKPPHEVSSYGLFIDQDLIHGPKEDSYFVASAINEYNLKNNASLILNMVSSLVDLSTFGGNVSWSRNQGGSSTHYNPPSDFVVNYLDNGGIDFYTGLKSENKAIYNSTPTRKGFINSDLIGLPYPNDANGNVQYSPSIFAEFVSTFGNDVFVREGTDTYQLMRSDNQLVMSYYLGTLIEGLEEVFILQGQYYGVINKQIFSIQFMNGVVANQTSVVSVENLQFVGNTPYEALFFSKTNRCLYSFTGANVLNQKQLVDKISEVRNYLYNPATQTVFLITDIGVLFYGLFGMFLLDYTDITNIFLLDNGIVLSDNSGNYRYIKYYLDEGDEGYTKENIRLDTCFYGMNNQTVTINDCLYFRLFSEEHEEGELKVSATTISLEGRKTEETTFKIKASDWDKITHTIYLRYQPKTQRGLGVSFSIDSPFKIASLSVGSQADAILVDKVSKGAINAPSRTSNNDEW